MVRLTDEEAEALAEYLFITLIPYIQDPDNWVDNLEWVRNMANVWHKCDRRQGEQKK